MWLFHESEGFRGPYLVADCANRIERHDLAMKRKRIIAEVDYNTAKRWGVLLYGPQSINIAMITVNNE